jgi:hypothetical protein
MKNHYEPFKSFGGQLQYTSDWLDFAAVSFSAREGDSVITRMRERSSHTKF